ncbi:hypothetical protein KSX_10140 [Ktedonospora formicarum]|uniref:LysM domain-containing protein n=2 Tax=Ktedonospora formicarum TaxID=2778364 RepID=A0A8J3MQJ8_9CHLR|nr:hypothetical protein KSX_10140 [Ktedonospora formicarum]
MGVIPYIVQDGDSCNAILNTQMQMGASTKIFNDDQKNTIQALNKTLGQNCGELSIGSRVQLQPQYPLVAFGGIVRKIGAPPAAEPTPTPAINLSRTIQQQAAADRYIDCTGGCNLTVQITEKNSVTLFVGTQMHVQVGSWVWAMAMMQPQTIKGFANYPYTSPKASINNMVLKACDFALEDELDDSITPCRKIMPNSIDDDGGAWLYGITGPHALGHWKLGNSLPPNTQTLMWLSSKGGDLQYEDSNPLYRYNAKHHIYVTTKKEKA